MRMNRTPTRHLFELACIRQQPVEFRFIDANGSTLALVANLRDEFDHTVELTVCERAIDGAIVHVGTRYTATIDIAGVAHVFSGRVLEAGEMLEGIPGRVGLVVTRGELSRAADTARLAA